MSASKEPKPPISDAKSMFEGWFTTKNPTLKGAEKPKGNKIPAKNIPK